MCEDVSESTHFDFLYFRPFHGFHARVSIYSAPDDLFRQWKEEQAISFGPYLIAG
jgi:hypothetical protein